MVNLVNDGKWIVLSNIFQKIVTFCLNQSIVFFIGPELIGISAIQLELFLSTLLFLSREGVRLSLLKITSISSHSSHDHQRFINLSWIPSVLVLFVSLFVVPNLTNLFQQIPTTILIMYCIGALFEAFGEPCINLCQSEGRLSPKVQAESMGIAFRSFTIFICLVYFRLHAFSFGIAQIVYGITYLLTLLYQTKQISGPSFSFVRLLPRRISPNQPSSPSSTTTSPTSSSSSSFDYFDSISFSSAIHSSGSVLLKHFLTEADKIALTLFTTSFRQGIFAAASNYASLIPRMLFLPVEDVSRIQFSQLLNQYNNLILNQEEKEKRERGIETTSDEIEGTKENEKNQSSQITLKQRKNNENSSQIEVIEPSTSSSSLAHSQCLEEMRLLLCQRIRLMMFIGLIFTCLGPNYVSLLSYLFLLKSKAASSSSTPYSTSSSSTPSSTSSSSTSSPSTSSPPLWGQSDFLITLSWNCLYLLFLGVNGISEAFAQAAMQDSEDFHSVNLGYILSTIVYILLVPLLMNSSNDSTSSSSITTTTTTTTTALSSFSSLFHSVFSFGLGWGTCGLVAGSCCATFVRILFTWRLIWKLFIKLEKKSITIHSPQNLNQQQKQQQEKQQQNNSSLQSQEQPPGMGMMKNQSERRNLLLPFSSSFPLKDCLPTLPLILSSFFTYFLTSYSASKFDSFTTTPFLQLPTSSSSSTSLLLSLLKHSFVPILTHLLIGILGLGILFLGKYYSFGGKEDLREILRLVVSKKKQKLQ